MRRRRGTYHARPSTTWQLAAKAPSVPADASTHWNTVYESRASGEVSWYQDTASTSLRLLAQARRMANIEVRTAIDVGAGQSPVSAELLANGWAHVTLLDVSDEALDAMREHFADNEPCVSFVVADLLDWQAEQLFDARHDRAVFHFLTDAHDRERYAATAARSIRPGGVMVIGTFASDGPRQCSSLPTSRYSPDQLAAQFAADFTLIHAEREAHRTPAGTVQPFSWAILR